MKTNSSYRYGCFHVGRTDMWGNYCPETGEYYLAHNTYDPVAGECVEVLSSGDQQGETWEYEAVRELLQLGHLTKKTLAAFIEAGGKVWWDQPNFFI